MANRSPFDAWCVWCFRGVWRWMFVKFIATGCKGLFTVNIRVTDCNVASKSIPLISMVLFTLSDTKHQTQSLTVNGPLQIQVRTCEKHLETINFKHFRLIKISKVLDDCGPRSVVVSSILAPAEKKKKPVKVEKLGSACFCNPQPYPTKV